MKIVAYKGTVSVDPNSIVEPELKKLLDETKKLIHNDIIFSKLCIFIFLNCDLSNDNPLVDRPYNTKREEALEVAFQQDLPLFKQIMDGNATIRDNINRCIEIYVKEVNTDEQKDIATYSKKMDQFRVMLHDMKPTIERNVHEESEDVSYSTNIAIINSVLENIVSLIQAKASMIALNTTGIVPKHLRGGLSPLTKGKITTTLDDNITDNEDEDG
jgi:hypothetical protein